MTSELPAVVAAHIAAVNAGDVDAIIATFATDAVVNDNHREMVGVDAIRRFVEKEIVGDQVTMEVCEASKHYGHSIVRARYDGTFDKTNLPAEVVLTNHFTLSDDHIVTLIIVFNQPSPY